MKNIGLSYTMLETSFSLPCLNLVRVKLNLYQTRILFVAHCLFSSVLFLFSIESLSIAQHNPKAKKCRPTPSHLPKPTLSTWQWIMVYQKNLKQYQLTFRCKIPLLEIPNNCFGKDTAGNLVGQAQNPIFSWPRFTTLTRYTWPF